ncbi:MAG: hypothetical protein FWE14_02380 [Lachnospiraceae bacterium]|nr:hypothetical protein [Lachnospiraceae bacterium]
MPYEIRPQECCKWLTVQKIQREFCLKNYSSFLDFCKQTIAEKWYIHVMLDYYHIQGAKEFKERHRIHDALIYGYNLEQEKIYAKDFIITRKYDPFTIPFDCINAAFDDCSQATNQDFSKGCVYLYKIDENCIYDLSIEGIIKSMHTYLEAVPLEYWTIYNCGNRDNIAFGHDIYKPLIAYLEAKPESFEIALFYLLYDHKRIMNQRWQFLSKQYEIDEAYLHSLKEIEIKAEIMMNLVVKYALSGNERILIKTVEQLKRIEEEEYATLSSILSSFHV